jgi:hypothetical protein
MIALHPIGSVNPLPHRSAELTAAALPGQGGENYLETLLNSPSGGRGISIAQFRLALISHELLPCYTVLPANIELNWG